MNTSSRVVSPFVLGEGSSRSFPAEREGGGLDGWLDWLAGFARPSAQPVRVRRLTSCERAPGQCVCGQTRSRVERVGVDLISHRVTLAFPDLSLVNRPIALRGCPCTTVFGGGAQGARQRGLVGCPLGGHVFPCPEGGHGRGVLFGRAKLGGRQGIDTTYQITERPGEDKQRL